MKTGWGCGRQVAWGKNKESHKHCVFHIYPDAPADHIITKFGLGQISGTPISLKSVQGF